MSGAAPDAPGPRTSASGSGSGTHPIHPRLVGGVWLVALVAGVFALLWAISAHAVAGNSDGATVVLEGQSMSAGNLTLDGWHLSLDSFWGIDAPIYAVAVAVAGIRPALLHAIPALLATAVVLVGMAMARDGRQGSPGVAGAVTVFALLGLPTYAMAAFFLQGPLHVGTALWCLIAFAFLRWAPPRWRWSGATVFLAAGCLGDAQMLVLGVAPLFLAGLVAMRRCRDWRAGMTSVTASVAAVVLALVVRGLALAVGTFSTGTTNAPASPSARDLNLHLAWGYLQKLLGVGTQGFGNGGVPDLLGLVHVVGALAVAAGVVVAVVGTARGLLTRGVRAPGAIERWRLDDLLMFAFFASVVLFVALTPSPVVSYARYLTAAVIFGSILAGRLVTRLATSVRRGAMARAVTGAGVAVVAAFVAGVGYELAQPLPGQPAKQLGQFLASHGLHEGLGDYWSASIVTVESSNGVTVRPVVATSTGRIVRYPKNSTDDWYDDRSFTFLIYNPALPYGNVDQRTATTTFGPPTRTYAVDGYFVLVWPNRVTVPQVAS
jgi:hypothetical protein